MKAPLTVGSRHWVYSCKSVHPAGVFIPTPNGRRVWVPQACFGARLASEATQANFISSKGGSSAPTGPFPPSIRGAEHGSTCVPPKHLRHAAVCARASTTGAAGPLSDGWKLQEPVLDGSLSIADRAVLALARAAENLSDRRTVEQAAAAHGLALVTNSDVCVGPLLPPFGFTMEEDGEEGDGMALPPPFSDAPRWERGSGTIAGAAASALLGAVFPGGATDAKGAVALSRATAASVAAVGGSPGLGPQRSTGFHGAVECSAAQPVRSAATPDIKLRNLSLVVAEGGGGDDEYGGEDEEALPFTRGSSEKGSGGGEWAIASSAASGLVDAAAAALKRVARAAVASTGDVPPPVGRAAAGAANAAAHAAQAAVATAAKATAHIMLPNYGDPSSSWLVADDVGGGVRYIVIAAGPDLHHRTPSELTTDLVTFETYNLGVKVNRRLYSEATALYARFMPLVMDFLEAVPDGNICFGGQGVGGSLAVLLQLMCCHRGLRFARLLPAVAVDSPAILGQVPLEQRRMWGTAVREQQRHLSQDSVEDVLEDIMQRTVLEELGLPHDAVRNLVLPSLSPAQQSSPRVPALPSSSIPSTLAVSVPLLSAWHGTGQHPQQSPALSAVLVLVAAGDGKRVATTAGGSVGSAIGSSVRPQVFRIVGKVVHVETIGSVSTKILSAPEPAEMKIPAVDTMVETDGGSGEPLTSALVMGGGMLRRFGDKKRLDAAMVGSIASAAATAAASAAVAQLQHVGTGAFLALTANRRRAASVTAPAALGPAVADSGTGMLRVAPYKTSRPTQPYRTTFPEEEVWDPEEDPSAWGV